MCRCIYIFISIYILSRQACAPPRQLVGQCAASKQLWATPRVFLYGATPLAGHDVAFFHVVQLFLVQEATHLHNAFLQTCYIFGASMLSYMVFILVYVSHMASVAQFARFCLKRACHHHGCLLPVSWLQW